jgi:hypothetical protein
MILFLAILALAFADGPCCFNRTLCTVVSESDCETIYTGTVGTGEFCSADSCPWIVGACCHTDYCQTVTSVSCTGVYAGDGTTCSQTTCPMMIGACCNAGSCVTSTSSECTGTYLGDNTMCNETNCPLPTIKCCLKSVKKCTSMTVPDCRTADGNIVESCASCGGSCCDSSNNMCNNIQLGDCEQCNGPDEVFAFGETCNGRCPYQLGACCTSTGCTLKTMEECLAASGSFGGYKSTCAECTSQSKGTCCLHK